MLVAQCKMKYGIAFSFVVSNFGIGDRLMLVQKCPKSLDL